MRVGWLIIALAILICLELLETRSWQIEAEEFLADSQLHSLDTAPGAHASVEQRRTWFNLDQALEGPTPIIER
jgi:hypothetical protein